MKKCLLLLLLFVFCSVFSFGQLPIPTPETIIPGRGVFQPEDEAKVYSADRNAPYLLLLQQEVLPQVRLKKCSRPQKAAICFLRDTACPAEGYTLTIMPDRIEIRASDEGGFVYAVQTLRQWSSGGESGKMTFPCATIYDKPRVGWRCFMLDSGRQYQSVATIKKYIDMASLLKMNRFHWHLTEGLGWRAEITRYPLLTEKGARVGKGEEQQGFYTREQMREIVRYAAGRNITVVPEIDMPGHAEAALVAYPALGCFGQTVEVPQIGFTENIFCAGKDSTLCFLKHVLDEICDIFPSPYIHLGGDEAPKGNWDKCPDCRKRIAVLHLNNSHDLQMWFSAQMADYLKAKGRKAIFWGDVVYQEGYPLPDNVVIQWWNYRGHKDLALRNALAHRYPVICSPNYYTYLNFPLTPWRGYGKARTFDLEDVYLRNPANKVLQEGDPLVWGMTCALWTDDGVTERMIDRRLFPRILALAEQMWHCGQQMDFETFYRNIQQRKEWFEARGFGFGPALTEEVDDNYKWE